MPAASTLDALVNPRERYYYALLVVVSLAAYAALAAMVVASAEAATTVVTNGLVFALVVFMARGLALGRLRGNAIRVSARQFPALHGVAARHAAALGLERAPDVFVVESGGSLNAFATRFLGRDFVIINSDVLAMAEESGEAAVGFIVAHELAHVRRGHLRHRWLTTPGRLLPYLGAAYSRACEYTCDRFGAHCQPDGAIAGLLVLAAGKQLYRQVDAREYAKQVETEGGFWVRRAELMSSHPTLPKRVAAILAHSGAVVPGYSPIRDGAARVATSAR